MAVLSIVVFLIALLVVPGAHAIRFCRYCGATAACVGGVRTCSVDNYAENTCVSLFDPCNASSNLGYFILSIPSVGMVNGKSFGSDSICVSSPLKDVTDSCGTCSVEFNADIPCPGTTTCLDGSLSDDPGRLTGYCTLYEGKPNCCSRTTPPAPPGTSECAPASALCQADRKTFECGLACSPNQLSFTDQVNQKVRICAGFADQLYASCKTDEFSIGPNNTCATLESVYASGKAVLEDLFGAIVTTTDCFAPASGGSSLNPDSSDGASEQLSDQKLAIVFVVVSALLLVFHV